MSFASNSSRRPFVLALVSGVSLAACVAGSSHAQNLSDRLQGVAEQQRAAAAANVSQAELLGALLYTDITVDFNATPLRDAIGFVSNALGVSLVPRFITERNSDGMDPDLEITLKADNKPALVVLEMILDQAGVDEACTWQLREGFIEVGTKSRLSVRAAQEVRMYPVRDLLFEAPRFDNAPEFDLNASIQQGNNGGGSGGGGNGGGGGGFGGGGGGGGFGGGGGGGGSGGGGGGGNIIGSPGDAPEGRTEEEKADELVSIITETIEPDAWAPVGDWATIRYYQGVLIVRAPDWIHRQLGGYPFSGVRARRTASAAVESRYVTFTAPISIVQNVKFRDVTVTGSAGGGTIGGGGNGGGGGNNSGSGSGGGNGGGGGGGGPAKPSKPPAK
jgi:hypothetical protein